MHEGYADNALNIKSMNINPGGKQKKLQDTRIPLNNPGPAPGEEDTHRHTIQSIIEDAGHICLFYHGFTASLMQLRCSEDMQSFVHVSHAAWSFISSFAFQDIVILQMGSLTLPKLLSHSVLIHAMSSQFASFSGRHGDILICTGICYLHMHACMCMCSVR